MKSFRVEKVCEPERLVGELQAVGVPVITIRASQLAIKESALYAVVITSDNAVDNTVLETIKNHVAIKTISKLPVLAVQTSAMKEMEKGSIAVVSTKT